jgi:hypothetical protein
MLLLDEKHWIPVAFLYPKLIASSIGFSEHFISIDVFPFFVSRFQSFILIGWFYVRVLNFTLARNC